MKKILFLHGFFASGQAPMADALRNAFEGRCTIISPDLSIHPKESIEIIRRTIEQEKPDILVGNSCGSFYAQMVASVVGIPALLGNPCFHMADFLKQNPGPKQFKSPRIDGQMDFIIDDALIQEFQEIETQQFDCCSEYWKDKVWGIFGENDQVAHCKPLFLENYQTALSFPGGHTPTNEEVQKYYVPAIEKLLQEHPKRETRYFQHFKGMKYKYIGTAFHSESLERMVIYQKQYGDFSTWVRPEKMFFEKVTRNGQTFSRFTEIS